MPEFDVHFRMPEAGSFWIELFRGEEHFRMIASYVLHIDAPEDLIVCLVNVLKGSPSTSMRWFMEPDEYFFEFRTSKGQTIFQVNEPQPLNQIKTHFEIELDSFELCLAFWRAFRCLQATILDDEYEQGWHRAFPDKQLDLLTQQIELAKKEQNK